MTKQELLQELQHETWVALQPSAVHGIGVFAICDIPKGCSTIFSKETGEWIELSMAEAEQLPAHTREFIETYYLYDEHNYFIPAHGCKIMDMANYLNHSDKPNIISVAEGASFIALRDIKKGEELLVDYKAIVEDADDYNSGE
jgi:SET domain-containing protein